MCEAKNRDVLVIGAGIAGLQTSLLLAEKGYDVHVLENTPAIGGFFPLLDRTFPTNSCGVCFMSPKPPAYCPIYESEFHENIELLTNCELKGLSGEAKDFEVSYVERPRYVDVEKCTLCGKCSDKCPVVVNRKLGAGIEKRKAVYLPFDQAIPRSYVIDDSVCTRCGACVEVCESGAIDLNENAREKKLKAGAIVLGFGFEPFRGEHRGEYGLGRYANVVSSVQYERMLSFSALTGGFPIRPSDGRRPKKVAIVQCVGSRDVACGQGYCSSICCMYATKQAMISKERITNLDVAIFFMDIRTMGKDYERYYERAGGEYGIRYIRSAVSTVRELQHSKRLKITYAVDAKGLSEEEFDMVVLSLGFTPPQGIREIAERLKVRLNEYNFCHTDEFSPNKTSVPGIFVAGAFRKPGDIPDTVVDASSAASEVSMLLGDSVEETTLPSLSENVEGGDDRDLRIGVFICDNRGVLSDMMDIETLKGAFTGGADIVCVLEVNVTSLKEGVEEIKKRILENNLNRVVLAGYRGMALRKMLKLRCQAVGSGRCLIEYANIGEQCVNVHAGAPGAALSKAKMIIHAGLRKANLAVLRKREGRKIDSRVLVVGGGIAGLTSCLSLAVQGIYVTLIEKSDKLGGIALSCYYTIKGNDVQSFIRELARNVESNPNIEVLKNSELRSFEGTWGNFRSVISAEGEEKEVTHGAVIFATGGGEAVPDEYLYGENDNVITQKDFEHMLADEDEKVAGAKTVVMIQCVGSRDERRPYCSKICCVNAVKNALQLKELNPEADVFVLYRDMRTYGFFEKYYYSARDRGILFIRYEKAHKPSIAAKDGFLAVSFMDSVLDERMNLEADLVVLSSGIAVNEDNKKLSEIAGLTLNPDGFFAEANPKAAPLDSVDRGKYFCGLCHSPNSIEDVICQGKAAAARASALLASGFEEYPEHQAYVIERLCAGCGLCVSACPYEARVIDVTGAKASVLPELCEGCGTCVITCLNGASQQYDFERSTIFQVLTEVME